MTSCIALGVANAAIKKGTLGKLKVEIPAPDERYHRQWPIPKVIECQVPE
jgi:hypothetical protein